MERQMQKITWDSGVVLHFPKKLMGMEYIEARRILFEGISEPGDQDIAGYQDKVTRLLPVFCKHAEGSDGKKIEVNMALYEHATPQEVDDIFAVMQTLWMEARATKKKSAKN
jgi:hypothetical protein